MPYLHESDQNKFTKNIPAEIGSLAYLNELDLSSNLLTGQIPTEIGTMANLQSLDLRSNQLTGFIPTEIALLAPTLADVLLCKLAEVEDRLQCYLTSP
jgi:Leucine-rich repeat (LRR) protein